MAVVSASASATAAASSSPPDCSVAEVSPPPLTGAGVNASASSQTFENRVRFHESPWDIMTLIGFTKTIRYQEGNGTCAFFTARGTDLMVEHAI